MASDAASTGALTDGDILASFDVVGHLLLRGRLVLLPLLHPYLSYADAHRI